MTRVTHGESGYQKWGCHCVACIRGHNKVMRAARDAGGSDGDRVRSDRRPMPRYATGWALTKGEYDALRGVQGSPPVVPRSSRSGTGWA
jgi:hypothetical protein